MAFGSTKNLPFHASPCVAHVFWLEDQLEKVAPPVSMPSLRRRGAALLLAALVAAAVHGRSAFSGCGCEGRHVDVRSRAVKAGPGSLGKTCRE